MAACLITVTGTSGKIYLQYKESSVAKSLLLGIGSIFLDDSTVTDLTYTVITGDVAISSSCLTLVSKPIVCCKLSWDISNLKDYKFVSFSLDGEEYTINPVSFVNSFYQLAKAVNELQISEIKITEGIQSIIGEYGRTQMILKVISDDLPVFKIANSDNTVFIYLKTVTATCSNTGYTQFNTCMDIT